MFGWWKRAHVNAQLVQAPIEYAYVYTLRLAGVTHGNRQKAVAGLKVGQALDLVREPDNRHDHDAVAVYARGQQVGYVPAFKSRMTAQFLDDERLVDAKVTALERFRDDKGRDALGVEMFIGFRA